MNSAVERRKNKFNNFKELRETGPEALEISITEVREYGAYDRIAEIADEGSFEEFTDDLSEIDPLDFPDYLAKKSELRDKTGLREAFVSGICTIEGRRCVIGIMDKRFLMGSMGIELGEKVCIAAERAGKEKLPLIIFTASGGARMQEGILSLMQMAKTSAVIEKFKENGGLYVVVLTHPTTGGVSASFAMLGDITLAEPGALIGFAGPRVIEQTIGEKLPEGFQRAEFQMEHGFVDQVVDRDDMRQTLGKVLRLHESNR